MCQSNLWGSGPRNRADEAGTQLAGGHYHRAGRGGEPGLSPHHSLQLAPGQPDAPGPLTLCMSHLGFCVRKEKLFVSAPATLRPST